MNSGKANSTRGTSGGISTLWSEDKFQLKSSSVSQHWIFTELFHNSSKLSFALFNCYVPINFNEKKDWWKSISDFLENFSPSNIIIVGGLNISLAPNEKKGGARGKDPFQDSVEAIIQSSDLCDFKPKKG